MLFVLTGSAGSGKSAALLELAARRPDLVVLDFDDLRPPADADSSWWREQLETHLVRGREAEIVERDTVLAGWVTLDELRAASSFRELEGVAVCLLDCDDEVRVSRIEERAATGSWRQHTPEELAGFLDAAEEMREQADDSVHCLDTSHLSISEVGDRLEAWMAEQAQRKPRTT
jgi:hypothetical protein